MGGLMLLNMNTVSIVPYQQARHRAGLHSQLDVIFFEASAVQTFESAAARAAFRERWLGRYLQADAAHAFLAVDERGDVVGYLVGCLDDPATLAHLADLPSVRAFASLSAACPAHLHINLAPAFRGSGTGQRLVEAFAAHAKGHGATGVHVVTGAHNRNVRFYRRCSFEQVDRWSSGVVDLVFLVRRLN